MPSMHDTPHMPLPRHVRSQVGQAAGAYAGEVLSMLEAGLADAYHEVNIEACACVEALVGERRRRRRRAPARKSCRESWSPQRVRGALPVTTHHHVCPPPPQCPLACACNPCRCNLPPRCCRSQRTSGTASAFRRCARWGPSCSRCVSPGRSTAAQPAPHLQQGCVPGRTRNCAIGTPPRELTRSFLLWWGIVTQT